MKNKITKLICFATSWSLAATGIGMHICKENSKNYESNMESYIDEFNADEYSIAAHRGFSSLEVENTVDAIKLAASNDYVDYIEVDVRLTNDNQLVLAHKNDVILSNGSKIKISDVLYDDLEKYTLSYKNNYYFDYLKTSFNSKDGEIIRSRLKELYGEEYQITSLKKAFNYFGNKKVLLDLKFSDKNRDIFIEHLVNDLENIDSSNIIIQSLDIDALNHLREMYPNYNYLALISNRNDLRYIDTFDYVGVKHTLIDEEKVQSAINDGKTVAVWTINSVGELNKVRDTLDDNSDDVIYITDYPDVITYELNYKQKKLVKTNH